MRVTAAAIRKLNPCKDRIENFEKMYPEYDGSMYEFLQLENISYSDKIWVAVMMLSKNQLVVWSIACAESVKHIYESRHPNNKSLSILLDYMKTIPDFSNLTKLQKAKLAVYRKAAFDASVHVDDAADAAYTAYTVTYAAYTTAAAYASYSGEEQQDLNLLFLASLLED